MAQSRPTAKIAIEIVDAVDHALELQCAVSVPKCEKLEAGEDNTHVFGIMSKISTNISIEISSPSPDFNGVGRSGSQLVQKDSIV